MVHGSEVGLGVKVELAYAGLDREDRLKLALISVLNRDRGGQQRRHESSAKDKLRNN